MIQALSLDRDDRICGYCATARASYRWFLAATAESANLSIQRQIIKSTKAYQTLRADLKRGCILPPLVLSARDSSLEAWQARSGAQPDEAVALRALEPLITNISPENIQIIDGLQRTNALRQISEELSGSERDEFLARNVRLEFWLNLPFNAIAYRMLLLNAGQKPMSMKHQIEVLSMKLKEDLEGIPNLEILSAIGPEAQSRRRVRAGQFQLAKLSQAFQAWLQGAPHVDISNTVMQELLADSAIETLGSTLATGDAFRDLISWIVRADELVCDRLGQNGIQFFGADTVLQGLAAAVGFLSKNQNFAGNIWDVLNTVLLSPSPDPLGIERFNAIREGINPGRRNVGVATRELVFSAFQQFFMSRGMVSMDDCWVLAGSKA